MSLVLTSHADAVGVVTLNHPEKRNALSAALVEALLPTVGAAKNEGYEGDGYVVVRDPSTARVQALITTIIETLKVHYTG